MTPIQIDKYDFRLIRLFKSGERVLVEDIRKIWEDRCALSPSVTEDSTMIEYVARHLLELAIKMGAIDSNFIWSLDSKKDWYYTSQQSTYFTFNTQCLFHYKLLLRLDNLFALTQVKYLIGYKKMLEEKEIQNENLAVS